MERNSHHDVETILGPYMAREYVRLIPAAGEPVDVKAHRLLEHSRIYNEDPSASRVVGLRLRGAGADRETLGFFAEWMGLPPAPAPAPAPGSARPPELVRRLMDFCDYESCVRAWRLGCALRAPRFRDDVLRVLLHCYRDRGLPLDAAEVAPYLGAAAGGGGSSSGDGVPRQSALHRLLVDMLCHSLEGMPSGRERRAALDELGAPALFDICDRVLEEMDRRGGGFMPMPRIENYVQPDRVGGSVDDRFF